MAGEAWTTMPLGEFVTLQRGHDLPDERRRPGHVPILGSFGITGWHDEAKASGQGVTVGRSGASFGVVSYSAVAYWPLNTALYVIDFHGNNERFAYYLLKKFDFSGYNSGSAQPSLNRNYIHPVPVDVPPLPEQRAIAHILGTLDDKIELNRRMNETLEAMARALFKSWFVDFDPVRAKRDGRDPGLPKPLADLFPDSFEDSELGEIPKGWGVQRFADTVDIVGGWYTQDIGGRVLGWRHPMVFGR
ncbi:MAG: restriction endonuclease subunit S [Rhodocyclaceae bacterium]|nr:restriction endonuclease subunit S [Rhodocyclaceae bacterium]